MAIDDTTITDDAPEFVKNRLSMQATYLHKIEETFDGDVRAIVPLFETEVRGVTMLERTADYLFA